jgi:hypothetical protein
MGNFWIIYKRSQLTVFMIFSIVILILSVFFIITFSKDEQNVLDSRVSIEVLPIKDNIESCLKGELEYIVETVSFHGGYYYNVYLEDIDFNVNAPFFSDVPFYINNNILSYPEKSDIESAIYLALINNIDYCIPNNFTDAFIINNNKDFLDINLSITKEGVFLYLYYPLVIEKEEKSFYINDFFVFLESNIFDLYEISKELTYIQFYNKDMICMSCISEISKNNDVDIIIEEFKDSDVIFFNEEMFLDESINDDIIYVYYELIKDNLSFNFAHAINETYFLINSNSKMYVADILNLKAVVGYPFEYKIEAYGEELFFLADTNLFNIDFNGLISFTPKEKDVGSYVITLFIKDKNGDEIKKNFILDIVAPVHNIKLNIKDYFIIYVDEEFNYKINVSNNVGKVYYKDNSSLFLIDDLGLINFIPTTYDKGIHNIRINAVDDKGGFGFKNIIINIRER